MRNVLTIIFATIALFASAETFTLQQCIDTAIANNIALLKQQNNYVTASIQYKQSLANISPNLSAGASNMWSFGRSTASDNITYSNTSAMTTSFNLNASLVLFDGLAMKFAIDQARASMLSSEASIRAAELQLQLNISSMYLQVLLNKQILLAAREQADDTQRVLHKDSLLLQANRLAEGEIYAVIAQLGNEQLQIVQAHNDVQLSLLNLAQAMNIDPQDFDNQDIPLDQLQEGAALPSRDDVLVLALSQRPEIRAQQYAIEAQEALLKQQKAAYSPTLSANAGMGTSYFAALSNGATNDAFGKQLGDNLQGTVGLTLSIPIYNKMQTPYAVKRQQINLDNARLSLEQQKQDIRKEVEQAYYNALNALTEAQAAEQALTNATVALDYLQKKFEAGRASSYEYTTAKTTFAKAQLTLLRSQYNYLFRLRILHYYAGTQW